MTTTELATIAGIAIVVILALVVLALCRAASYHVPPPDRYPKCYDPGFAAQQMPPPPAPPPPQEHSAAYWREAYYTKETYADGLRQELNRKEAALKGYRRAALFAAATNNIATGTLAAKDADTDLRRLLREAQEADQ